MHNPDLHIIQPFWYFFAQNRAQELADLIYEDVEMEALIDEILTEK